MSGPDGRVTVSCSWHAALRHRPTRLLVDGAVAGTIGRGGRRELVLAPGRRTLDAARGRWDAAPVALDLAAGGHRFVLLEVAPPSKPGGPPRDHVLALVETDGLEERRQRQDGYGGYSSSPRERRWSRVGGGCLMLGLLVRVLFDSQVGQVIMFPGTCIVVVLFFRRFLFRRDQSESGPPG